MKKIAIVCDSSVSLTPNEIDKYGIYLVPLTIIHDGNEYLDQITITSEDVNNLLRKNEVLTTSQPNLGHLIELFETLKEKKYDHIFCLPLTRHLSGTHRTFVQAKNEVGLDNMEIIDTLTLVAPIQRMVNLIITLNKKGESIETINKKIQDIIDHNESYIFPKDLKQLRASGRISPTAATMASLLRIKPILKFENKGEIFDKFNTARTEKKAIDIIIDDLIKQNVKPETHYIDFLESENLETVKTFITRLEERIGKFEMKTSKLPSSLATHAGIGTVAVQWTKKVN